MEPIVQTGYFSEESAKDFIMCITEAIIEQTIDMLVDYGVFIKKGMMRMMKKLIITMVVWFSCSVAQPVVLA